MKQVCDKNEADLGLSTTRSGTTDQTRTEEGEERLSDINMNTRYGEEEDQYGCEPQRKLIWVRHLI